MPNTRLTTDYLWRKVTRALGGSGVDVELVKEDVEDAFEDAISEYNRNKPRYLYAALSVSPSIKKYQLDNLHPSFQGVIETHFISQRVNEGIDPFDPWFLLSGGAMGEMSPGEYEQIKGYYEDARKVFASNPTWRGQWEQDGHYYLYVDIVETTYPVLCCYKATWHITPDDDANTGMSHVQDGDVKWLVDYTISQSKKILSYIRGKYQGIAGPEGDFQIDWDRLKQEGEDEERALMEDLHMRRRPIPPIIG